MGMWDWIEEQYPAPGSRVRTNGFPPLSAADAAALARAMKTLYARDEGWLTQAPKDWLQNSPLPRGGYPAWPSPSSQVSPMSAPLSPALSGESAAIDEPSASQAARDAGAAMLARAARHPYGRRLFASAVAPDGQPHIEGMPQADKTRQSESSEGNDHHLLPHLPEQEAVESPPGDSVAPLLEPWDRDPPPAARYWRPNQGEMRSYEPSLRERFHNVLLDLFGKMGRLQAQHYAEGFTGLANMTPLGIPFAVNDMKRAADRGSPLGVVTSAIGALPAGRLPMNQAARLARAEKMGFWTNMPLAHGTAADFRSFDLSKRGATSGAAPAELGVWTEVRKADSSPIADEFAKKAAQKTGGHPSVMSLLHRADNPAELQLTGRETNDQIFGTLAKAWDDGYDAVLLNNYTSPGGKKGTILVVKDPAQLRAPTAKFDLRKRNKNDLLASFGGAGFIGLGAGANQDAQGSDEP